MLALAELWYKRNQFAIIGLIVALVAYLAFMMSGLGSGLLDLAGSAVKQFDADALVFSERSRLGIQVSELSAETVNAVQAAPGITDAAPVGYLSVLLVGGADQDTAAFVGVPPGSIAQPPLTAGRAPNPGERGVVIADQRFLDDSGTKLGDTVTVASRLGTESYQIVGAADRGALFFQPVLYGVPADWQTLRYGAEGPDVPAASFVMVKGGGSLNVAGAVPGVQAATLSESFEAIPGVAPQRGTANSILGFGLIIGALVVGAFFYVLTIQKIGQIGVLKAVGASSWFIARQLLLQVAVVVAIGLLVALPLAALTNELLLKRAQIPILLTSSGLITTSVLLMVAALVASAVSARQVTKVDPLIALGQQQ
jgi:putative ABC transport system permease protein